jgi:hypothetical protein
MSTDTITDRIFNLKSVASKLEKDSLAAVAELGGITDGLLAMKTVPRSNHGRTVGYSSIRADSICYMSMPASLRLVGAGCLLSDATQQSAFPQLRRRRQSHA